jgi:hypothetical protein
MAVRLWERVKAPWMVSLALSGAFVLLTVVLNLVHGTYRHSVGGRIYGDLVIWLAGACVVRLVMFIAGRFDRRRKHL